jgi:hypothetical protein
MNIWLLVLWLTGVGWSNPTTTDEAWDVTVEVAMRDGTVGTVRAEVDWLGTQQAQVLRDDGQGGDLTAGDNVFSATFTGGPIRFLPVSFSRKGGDGWTDALEGHRSIERVPWQGGTLSFGLTAMKNLTIQRLSSSAIPESVVAGELKWMAAGMLWAWACLLFVLSLAPPRNEKAREGGVTWPGWASPVIWASLAALWTWPSVLAGGERAVGRHFDLSGTIWSLSAIPRLIPDLIDPLTAWPLGADYTAFDSFMLIPLGVIFQWADPIRLHAWLGILGVATSAWAAEAFARTVGAKQPWSLIAGLTFGFSGLAATALLEGHVYHVIDPWLPLFALYWWRTCGTSGTARDALTAGFFFVLTFLTTAYLGVAAAIVAIGFAVGGMRRREIKLKNLFVAAAIVAPVLAAVLMGISDTVGGPESTHRILLGSAQFSNLSIPSPEIDRDGHSVAVALGGIAFALTWLAPAVLRPGRWRVLLWTAAAALILSFGPALSASTELALFPLPTYPLWQLPILGHLRFPIRLLWAWMLCSGVIAALVATTLAEQRRAGWLIPIALIHAFVFVGLPLRQTSMLGSTPKAYEAVQTGAILELMPTGADPSGEFDNWMSATTCFYQAIHGRAIAEDCVSFPVQDNPRMRLARWVEDRLLEGDTEEAQSALSSAGFGAVAWHRDLYSPGDRMRLGTGLDDWDGVEKSTDGGEHIWMYPLIPSPIPTPVATLVPAATINGNGGMSGPAEAKHIFVDLHVPFGPIKERPDEGQRVADWPEYEYAIRYIDLSGTRRSAPLTNDGATPGDWHDDYTWSTLIQGPLPAQLSMDLTATRLGSTSVVWAGSSWISDTNDRLAFMLTDGTARPVSAGSDRPAPPARRRAGLVGTIGWIGWGLLFAMWHLRRRRQS